MVPGEMNLHAMHYMIQRLFGWLNGHLHNFRISEADFNALTGGKVGGWKNLCGSLLHFSMDEEPDMYWDDDYKPGQSAKTWYRNKYTGPYISKATCDTYYDARRSVDLFSERFPRFNSEMTLPEMHDQVVMEELRVLIDNVRSKQAPRCIASDGLNVLDDVGGIGGFHDMLLILEGDDQEEKQSTKSWARGLGWTGTLSKPELML